MFHRFHGYIAADWQKVILSMKVNDVNLAENAHEGGQRNWTEVDKEVHQKCSGHTMGFPPEFRLNDVDGSFQDMHKRKSAFVTKRNSWGRYSCSGVIQAGLEDPHASLPRP